jgi:hypothetical protein
MLGTLDQALNGEMRWEERDYGLICPACILDEKYLEEVTEESGAIDGNHPVFELAAEVLKPETSVETTTGTLHDDGTFEVDQQRLNQLNTILESHDK